ncbi:MAG TPA: hypothetical protein VEZ14_04285 [Dehalococcoidia bacterium]|nr:hypothetical protein [Dehalococcoidia bacterium]
MNVAGRFMWMIVAAPVMGIFFLVAHIFAPAVIVLATVLLHFNSTLAFAGVAACAAAWILVLPAIGYVHVNRRYDSRVSISERWAVLLIGAFAPLGFLVAMIYLPFGGVLRWFASVELAASVAGLISGIAVTIRQASIDREFPLP